MTKGTQRESSAGTGVFPIPIGAQDITTGEGSGRSLTKAKTEAVLNEIHDPGAESTEPQIVSNSADLSSAALTNSSVTQADSQTVTRSVDGSKGAPEADSSIGEGSAKLLTLNVSSTSEDPPESKNTALNEASTALEVDDGNRPQGLQSVLFGDRERSEIVQGKSYQFI